MPESALKASAGSTAVNPGSTCYYPRCLPSTLCPNATGVYRVPYGKQSTQGQAAGTPCVYRVPYDATVNLGSTCPTIWRRSSCSRSASAALLADTIASSGSFPLLWKGGMNSSFPLLWGWWKERGLEVRRHFQECKFDERGPILFLLVHTFRQRNGN